ncbi:MAG: CRISPR system precrRNA processing endoribonuclease RAMP protein Cas6 [Bifidobacteriaceae bacterium]|jgi:CRISPR-associated endoribonuclease Cas6|nr:CRISPR system precrRNA processing endoribonuclease RAMP protein Cas6 [Bifidobacteriaceae bacterium]
MDSEKPADGVFGSLELELEPPAGFCGAAFDLGPYLQGVIMEEIASDFAEFLHSVPLNPYSQSCTAVDGGLVWRVNTLTADAYEQVLGPLQAPGFDKVQLRAVGNATFRIRAKTLRSNPAGDVTRLFYADPPRSTRIIFATPSAFKQGGRYVFHPDIRLLFQSSMMRYSYFFEGSKEPDEEVLDRLTSSVHITSYRLSSRYFPVGQTKIPAFTGQIVAHLGDVKSLAAYANMLMVFATWTGIGAKTALGMGSIRVEPLVGRAEKTAGHRQEGNKHEAE